jgi:hypothetical protein
MITTMPLRIDTSIKDLEFAGTQSDPIIWQHDPLHLSCESYLLSLPSTHTTVVHRYMNLSRLRPSGLAMDLAERIRSYYLGTLSFQTLKGTPLSSFRKKLYAFLMGEYQLKQDELGLLYKLPYFYADDQQLIEIAEQTESVDHVLMRDLSWNEVLTPLKRVIRVPRSGERGDWVTYWWRTRSNCAVMMDGGEKQGNFASLMDGLFVLGRELHFEAQASVTPVLPAPHHRVWKIRRPQLVMQ